MIRGLGPAFLLALTGCVGDFPPPPFGPLIPTDAGTRDVGGADVELVDARSPRDRGVELEPDTMGGCSAIVPGRDLVRFRAWDTRGPDRIELGVSGGCPPLKATTEASWLDASFEVDRVVLTTQLGEVPAGVRRTEIIIEDAQGNRERLPVVLEHFAEPSANPAPKVLVYAVGGLPGASRVNLPANMEFLAGNGWTVANAKGVTDADTEGARWASLLTGVGVSRHGVDAEPERPAEPSFVKRANDAGKPSVVVAQWRPIIDSLIDADLAPDAVGGDRTMVRQGAIAMLSESNADLFFVATDEPARVARIDGVASDGFSSAVSASDVDLDRLLTVLLERPNITREDWLIVLVGVPVPEANREESWPLIFARPGRPPRMLDASTTALDVAPTVLAHLGVMIQDDWRLPGSVVGQPREQDCNNGQDDDGDGRFDCRDSDCAAQCDLSCIGGDAGSASGLLARGAVDDDPSRFEGSCQGGESAELVLNWTAPTSDTWLFHASGSEFDTTVYVRRDDCVGRELACSTRLHGRGDDPVPDPGGVAVPVEAGRSVVIFADGERAGASGEVWLSAYGQRAVCEGAMDLGSRLGEVARVSNDGVPTRINPRLGVGLDLPGPQCAERVYPAADVLFTWRAPAEADYVIDTNGSDFDTVIRVFREGCEQMEPFLCDDDSGDRAQSRVDFFATAGRVAIIAVGGYWQSASGGWRGETVLNIRQF